MRNLIYLMSFMSIFFFNTTFADPFLKIVKTTNTWELKFAIRTYKKNGNTIKLLPVIHFASQQFYERINEIIKNKTVIYELAGGTLEEFKRLEKAIQLLGENYLEIYEKIKLIGNPHELLALKYGLAEQGKSLNFSSASKLIHADIKGNALVTLIEKPLELKNHIDLLIKEAVRPSILNKHNGNSIAALTEEINNQLKSNDSLLDIIKRSFDENTIQNMKEITKIEERNKFVKEILNELLNKKQSQLDVAIVYGVDHMPDIEDFIINNLGFKLENEEWVDVIDLNKNPVVKNI